MAGRRSRSSAAQPGELLEVVRGRLTVVAYEQVVLSVPRPAVVQRICTTERN
jgi:hypothetical protein